MTNAIAESATTDAAAAVRKKRNEILAATDWVQIRHEAELLSGRGVMTTLTANQIAEFLRWRHILRVLPTISGFPYAPLPQLDPSIAAKIGLTQNA